MKIGDLRRMFSCHEKKRERTNDEKKEKNTSKKKRQIKWNPTHYECIKEGSKLMENLEEINSLTEPREEYFFIYKNVHECASRDKDVPLYEAVYKCKDDTYVRVQINHLKTAYMASGKKDCKKAWNVFSTTEGVKIPYWVDRFAFSKMK